MNIKDFDELGCLSCKQRLIKYYGVKTLEYDYFSSELMILVIGHPQFCSMQKIWVYKQQNWANGIVWSFENTD